jgi:hypothetical protein
MRQSASLAVVAIGLVLPAFATGQPVAPSSYPEVPRLADIMATTQLRHLKLWFAGREKNWTLANYELAQIKISFQDALRIYPNVPAADMTIMTRPATAIDAAIQTKDAAKFTAGFGELTTACNVCHRSQGMAFIAIKVPTSSPFSNQSFTQK